MQLFIRRQEFVLRGHANLAHLAILCLAAVMILMPWSAFAQLGGRPISCSAPSYSPSGVNPSWGCWGWVYESTSLQWFSSGATDRDYACVVTAPTGTIVANNIGNVTGWTGRAWNLPSRQATFVWGYPAASLFPGNSLIRRWAGVEVHRE